MKNLLLLLIVCMLQGSFLHGFDHFARAEEFGAPRLDMSRQNYLQAAEEREWHVAGHAPIKATLTGINGEWGNRAQVIVTTPKGRKLNINITDISDADTDYVRQWYESNDFVTIKAFHRGSHPARIISAIYNQNGSHIIAIAAKTDGELQTLYVPNCECNRVYAQHHINTYAVEPKTLRVLREHADRVPPGDTPPLPVAENVNEAIAYSALRGTAIVVLFLNRRGSSLDKEFRRYISEHPDAVKRWSKHYVFLIAYCQENGYYSDNILKEEKALAYLYNSGEFGHSSILMDDLGYIYYRIYSLYEAPPGASDLRRGAAWSLYIPRFHKIPASHSLFHKPDSL